MRLSALERAAGDVCFHILNAFSAASAASFRSLGVAHGNWPIARPVEGSETTRLFLSLLALMVWAAINKQYSDFTTSPVRTGMPSNAEGQLASADCTSYYISYNTDC